MSKLPPSMRLFLLPISTRRTLIYCERLHNPTSTSGSQPSYLSRATNKANETWASWERAEGGWKKQLTQYGNQVLKRIPYEEWGLKTIPGMSERRKKEYEKVAGGMEGKVEVLFPGMFLKEQKVPNVLKTLATERQALHTKRLWWSIVGMPLSAPFMLVPVVPNIPFFYLVFRAYSHWKALNGSKHLQYLCENSILEPRPSLELDEVYTAGLMYPTRAISRSSPLPTTSQSEAISNIVEQQTNGGTEDVMLLQRWNGKLIAERFKLPDMEIEIERAVEQVENSIKAKDELAKEKRELEQATAKPDKFKKDEKRW